MLLVNVVCVFFLLLIDNRTITKCSLLKKCEVKNIYVPYVQCRHFDGLCAQYVNDAIDSAMALNFWPVMFTEPDGTKSELVTEFTIAVWAKYCSRMEGKPSPHSNACQLVLKYMLLNPMKIAKAWRARLYYYSSGSMFQQVVSASKTTDEEDDM